jgi:hypothetical protein
VGGSSESPILLNARAARPKNEVAPRPRAALRIPQKSVPPHGKEAAPVVGAASPSINPLCRLLHLVGGRGIGSRLQPVKIISGLLRMAGGGEDRPLVVLQDFEP